MGHSPNRRPSSNDQRQFIKDQVGKAIQTICRSWDDANEAVTARGYSGSGDGSPVVMTSHVSDPTFSAALQPEAADDWIRRCKGVLTLLLRSSAESVGRNRWSGPFYPPTLESTFVACAWDLIELWPVNFGALIDRIYDLADQAKREWPEKPKPGQTIDGVEVGKRKNQVEICVECKGPVMGDASDPLARIDGRPYHRKPCYQTVWQRQKRKRGA